jgi:ribosomal protein S18 acetylase RimI-like enzyme
MLVLSALTGPGAASTAAAVARDAVAVAFANNVQLVQMLIQPDDTLHGACLRDAGFRTLASLHTMERTVPHRLLPEPRHLRTTIQECNVTLVPCLDLPTSRVAATLEATYAQTQDCPGLLGIRTAADTLAGHRATGEPLPELWSLVHVDGQDAGVLFVCRQKECCDLIYTGLIPAVRGKGVGMWLLRTMLSALRHGGHKRIRLCVDSNNAPALALYRAAGFTVRATTLALIATPEDVQAAP